MSTEPGNKEPIRVAHVIGRLTAAGVEAVINNYYRHIDHDKYQFDYIVDDDSPCSSVSTWEVLLKHDRKPGELHYDLQRFLDGCLGAGFSPLNLCDRHIAAVETLERPETVPEHNDPFDKLLLAQAKTENLLFLTHDRKIDQYDEPCVFLV